MRAALLLVVGAFAGLVGGISAAQAQPKTARECEAQWTAHKADFLAKGISEKAYVTECLNPAAASTAPPPAAPKTIKECEAEWLAHRADFKAQGISELAYVVKCRKGPVAGPVAASPPAAVPPPVATGPAPAPPSSASAAPPPPPAPSSTARATAPSGKWRFAVEAEAKAHCPAGTVVWANLRSKVYHFSGDRDYGNTKNGAYMCEADATAQGFRAAKSAKRPS